MVSEQNAPLAVDSEQFERDGYLVLRQFVGLQALQELRAVVDAALTPLLAPAEFESDVGYPGAPADRTVEGGATPRRLLHALSRNSVLRAFATSRRLGDCIRSLLGVPQVLVSQSHHNCIMTKHPGYSSRTGWHQDIRYWSFDRPALISTWLAFGSETLANGGLLVIPESHRLDLDRGRLDAALFLREDLAANRALIERAKPVLLEAGDLLLFHCRLFHAAGANRSSEAKLSLVFTCHAEDNHAIPGTRSAHYPALALA